MSVPTTSSRYQSIANGTGTTFPFPALVYFANELIVISTDPTTNIDTVCILDTDYTIDPADLGQPTGVNVVFGTAPDDGLRITIARVVPNVQPVELVEGAGLPSAVLERQLDETVFMVQQLQDDLERIGIPPLSQIVGSKVYFRGQDYIAYDVSSGVTPQLSFTVGNHRDSTGVNTWVPSIGGVLLTNNPPPILIIGSTDTVVYFDATINSANGAITALTISSGTSVPSDTTTHAYQLMTNIVVTISTIAQIAVNGGGVSGSQNYFYCGPLPAVDGSGHLFNS